MKQTCHSDNPISSFTLDDLIRMAEESHDPENLGLYARMRDCIVTTSNARIQALRHPCRIDAYVIGIGTEGETTQTFNLKEYRLRKDTLFIVSPRDVVQRANDGDTFKAHVIILTPSLLQRVNIDAKRFTPLLLQFAAHPCLELTPEESRMLRSFISMVESELQAPETLFTSEIIEGLISALIYKAGAVLSHYLTEHPEEGSTTLDRTEEYFRRFTTLLGEHYIHERSVAFYARQLCITPKYLTTMIKRVSGKSASEWIDTYVILEAKTLLKYSHKSIQEIAYHLNFPNQSFFGSYFKRNTGMSPSQFKAGQQ